MRKSFLWSRHGRTIIAELLDTEKSQVNTPEEDTDVQASCILKLFTHVAKVEKLTEHFGFVKQNSQTTMHHRFVNIHSTRGDESDCAGILLDSVTQSLKNEYKLACIGKGQRGRLVPSEDGVNQLIELDWVVLLLEQRADGYERIGLTTVQPDKFEWMLEWIHIM